MYLSKESVINLFFQMNFLYSGEDIQKQGGTQFYSELKYFLALDEFVASEKRPCNTRDKDDKQKFINNVGHVVQLSSPDANTSLDAKNFFDSFGQNKDFDVGSNFFSAGAVNKSLTSTSPLPYPSRHPQLLKCENGVIDIADGAYQRFANEQDYLYYQDRKKKIVLPNKKALLFFWLNRNTSFTDKSSLLNDFLNNLQMHYSQKMISSLGWNKNESVYINIAKCLTTSENVSFLEKEDLLFDSKDWFQRKKYFETWLCLNSSGDDGFRAHCVDVCEQWLDKKMPGNQIGNLFRHKDYDLYKKEHDRIMNLKDFESVSNGDQSGRPRTAVNHYLNFLNRMPRLDKVANDDFVELLELLKQEVEKKPERIDALKRVLFIENDDDKKNPALPFLSDATPTQIIYYGVPGSGKSHQIQEDLKKKGITEENHQQKRVVFHPDYCNADFVGQILPVTKKDGGIRYQFKAGPFTKILRDAYENPDKEYALIIEEINRGNAAAIFGDLFQLLDRKRENDPVETVNGNSYGPGWSDYCVENDYINAYFRGAYDLEDVLNPLPSTTLGNITFNDNVDIRLPPNLSIYATMNTSDQNVFTLDNAFQRRWEMKQISNDLAHDDPAADTTKQYDQIIGSTGVKWGEFREKINEIIMQSAEENGLSSMEDKRLGGWFITPKKEPNAAEGETPKITDEAFAEKVLKYLWDDAFKFDRPKHFGEIKTLEDLTKEFKKEGFKVFEDESISKLSQENGTTSAQTRTSET